MWTLMGFGMAYHRNFPCRMCNYVSFVVPQQHHLNVKEEFSSNRTKKSLAANVSFFIICAPNSIPGKLILNSLNYVVIQLSLIVIYYTYFLLFILDHWKNLNCGDVARELEKVVFALLKLNNTIKLLKWNDFYGWEENQREMATFANKMNSKTNEKEEKISERQNQTLKVTIKSELWELNIVQKTSLIYFHWRGNEWILLSGHYFFFCYFGCISRREKTFVALICW